MLQCFHISITLQISQSLILHCVQKLFSTSGYPSAIAPQVCAKLSGVSVELVQSAPAESVVGALSALGTTLPMLLTDDGTQLVGSVACAYLLATDAMRGASAEERAAILHWVLLCYL